MSKLTRCISGLAVVLLSCVASLAGPARDDCPATEIAVNSFGISSRVVVVERGRERRTGRIEVDAFIFTRGEWQPAGAILGGGGFGWKAGSLGRHKLVIRHEGYKAATLIVNVRSLKGK